MLFSATPTVEPRTLHSKPDDLGGSLPPLPSQRYATQIGELLRAHASGASTDEVVRNLQLVQQSVATNFQKLSQERPLAEVSHLAPENVMSFYKGYRYTCNVDHQHIAKMLPGYQQPTPEHLADAKVIQDAFYGTMPGAERAILTNMLAALRPRSVLEIGTHMGHLTNDIIRAVPSDCVVVTVDLPVERWSKAKFPHDATQYEYINKVKQTKDFPTPGCALTEDPKYASRIVSLLMDSSRLPEVFGGSTGMTFDAIIVDGNHTRMGQLSDILNAFSLVSPGGMIAIDDVNKPFRLEGVSHALYTAIDVLGKQFYWANWQTSATGNLAFHLNIPEATSITLTDAERTLMTELYRRAAVIETIAPQ